VQFAGQESLRLLHRFGCASTDVGRNEEVPMAASVFNQRIPQHAFTALVTKYIQRRARDPA
jgi:hypothetical protein